MITQVKATRSTGQEKRSRGSAGAIPSRMKVSFTDHASTVGEVSAFVHAVVKIVIPHGFLGGADNQKVVMRHIDRFIRLRRFEVFSIHDVLQGLRVSPIPIIATTSH